MLIVYLVFSENVIFIKNENYNIFLNAHSFITFTINIEITDIYK